ncbi:TPA: fimbrial protein [Salmonella enterica subsp. diarizonae]|nr:fimbrial protein [Salmonella enterica subsp. diarizonae]HAU2969625.1 fimbrial protein [Salmonella enterica subsp. diarizonae]
MNKKFLVMLVLLKLSSGYASTTVTSKFEITNRVIETAAIISTDNTMSYSDVGNGLYKLTDSFNDANATISGTYAGVGIGLNRLGSLFSITMVGKNLGHRFVLKGKYSNASLTMSGIGSSAVRGYGLFKPVGGCSLVDPSSVVFSGATSFSNTINSNSNVNADCIDRVTASYWTGSVQLTGVSRDIYLDVGALQKDANYRKAPPDDYVGSGVYALDRVATYGNVLVRNFVYVNNVEIIKNPYFEKITLSSGDNLFDVRTTGNNIIGNLIIPYVINGHFTPYNRIILNVTSSNGFKLKDISSKNSIPYSLFTRIGGQKSHSLAISGVSNGTVTIGNLSNESYALQGRFNSDFSIDKSTAQAGDYSDELTAIFQVEL